MSFVALQLLPNYRYAASSQVHQEEQQGKTLFFENDRTFSYF